MPPRALARDGSNSVDFRNRYQIVNVRLCILFTKATTNLTSLLILLLLLLLMYGELRKADEDKRLTAWPAPAVWRRRNRMRFLVSDHNIFFFKFIFYLSKIISLSYDLIFF